MASRDGVDRHRESFNDEKTLPGNFGAVNRTNCKV